MAAPLAIPCVNSLRILNIQWQLDCEIKHLGLDKKTLVDLCQRGDTGAAERRSERRATMEIISHRIDGGPQDGDSCRAAPMYDPATGKERGRVAFHAVFCPPFCPP
jgi:hypothetical protein